MSFFGEGRLERQGQLIEVDLDVEGVCMDRKSDTACEFLTRDTAIGNIGRLFVWKYFFQSTSSVGRSSTL